MAPLNILLLCDYKPNQAATVVEHVNALYSFSKHRVDVVSGLIEHGGNLPKGIYGNEIDLAEYDVIIIHYSLSLAVDAYISQRLKKKISQFKGCKVVFIQDEYRFVNRTIDTLNELGVNILYTCVPDEHIESVYPKKKLPNTKCINVLTGYVPYTLLDEKPRSFKRRKYDLVYRGRIYPAWHGRQGLEKWKIAEAFNTNKLSKKKLKRNISCKERDRIYGKNWMMFLKNSKAVLAVESGCSVFDFDGDISVSSELYTKLMGLKIEKDYERIKNKFFAGKEDLIDLAQLSPRIFEAIALKTVLVAYEGEYSGALQAWKHYIPVKKDHSNMDEVVNAVKDDELCADISTNAFVDVAMNPEYSYSVFVKKVDSEISEEFSKLTKKPHGEKPYSALDCYDFSRNICPMPHHFSTVLSVGNVQGFSKLVPDFLRGPAKKLYHRLLTN